MKVAVHIKVMMCICAIDTTIHPVVGSSMRGLLHLIYYLNSWLYDIELREPDALQRQTAMITPQLCFKLVQLS